MIGADPLISRFYTKRRKGPLKTLITRNNLFGVGSPITEESVAWQRS
jgi:hypothetical protein